MSTRLSNSRLLDGTFPVFLADALVVPTGLLTVALLTRRFGPEGYGIYAIAATIVAWIEGGIISLFSRLTIQFVAEADQWQAIAGTLIRWHLAAGGLSAMLLGVLAHPLASLLEEPALSLYLVLFAVDIPLFMLAQAHRNILTGIGEFRARALASAARWIGRLLLIALLVQLGLSIPGVILGSIGASIIELVICRCYITPPLLGACLNAPTFPRSALPVMLSTGSLNFYTKLDLLALKILGGTSGQAGFYAAAQNLSVLPGVFAQGFSGILTSMVSQRISEGDTPAAKEIVRKALTASISLLPIAGLFAGAAPEITELCFGPAFRPAANLLAILIFGAIAYVVVAVATAVLTAFGEASLAFRLTGPLVPLGVLGHFFAIPRLGAIGAAVVTTGLGFMLVVLCTYALWRLWRIHLPATTFLRSVVLCVIAYVLAALWPGSGLWLLIKLACIGAGSLAAFWLFEPFDRSAARRIRWLVP